MGCWGDTARTGWSLLPQKQHSGARPTGSAGTWLYWFYFQQGPKRSGDTTSLQPSPAQHSGCDPSPLPLQLAEVRDGPGALLGCPGREQAPAAGMQSPGAAPWLSWGSEGSSPPAASTRSPLPPHGAGRRDRPRGSQQCQRPPVRKSIHFITDLKSARGSARRIRFTRDVSIFQQGEGKRGTNPTDPTHGSLVLENTRWCSREKLWVRGALAEMRGDASAIHHHPPCPKTPAKNL